MLTHHNAIMHKHIPFRKTISRNVTITHTLKAFLTRRFSWRFRSIVEGLDSLGLKEESLEGNFEKDFLFFQELL